MMIAADQTDALVPHDRHGRRRGHSTSSSHVPSSSSHSSLKKRSQLLCAPLSDCCTHDRAVAPGFSGLWRPGDHIEALKVLGEGIEDVGRVLERTVTDAGAGLLAAATMLVDDVSLRKLRQERTGREPAAEGIAAFARFRPTEGTEGRIRHTESEVHMLGHAGMMPLVFHLDGVLGTTADQSATYARVGAPLLEAALRGQSQTLVVCGAADGGKTYTLFGWPEQLAKPSDTHTWRHWGLLPRLGHHLFAKVSAAGGVEALLGPGGGVSCSFVEVRERVRASPAAAAGSAGSAGSAGWGEREGAAAPYRAWRRRLP
jgi:hypothetical protein